MRKTIVGMTITFLLLVFLFFAITPQTKNDTYTGTDIVGDLQ